MHLLWILSRGGESKVLSSIMIHPQMHLLQWIQMDQCDAICIVKEWKLARSNCLTFRINSGFASACQTNATTSLWWCMRNNLQCRMEGTSKDEELKRRTLLVKLCQSACFCWLRFNILDKGGLLTTWRSQQPFRYSFTSSLNLVQQFSFKSTWSHQLPLMKHKTIHKITPWPFPYMYCFYWCIPCWTPAD